MTAIQSSLPAKWGPHLHGLHNVAGLHTVATDYVDDVELRVREAITDRAIVLVTGAYGLGKSFATARAVEAAAADHPELDPVWVEFAGTTTNKALALDLYPQVTGTDAPCGLVVRELRATMAGYLAEKPRILVVDEAQNVGPAAFKLLRWLWDRPESQFALVIVGTPDVSDKLPGELRSRIMSHVHFERIADDDAPELLAAYHPMFDGVDRKTLTRTNRSHAQGSFRWWAKFLIRADRYLAELGGELNAEAIDSITFQMHRESPRKR